MELYLDALKLLQHYTPDFMIIQKPDFMINKKTEGVRPRLWFVEVKAGGSKLTKTQKRVKEECGSGMIGFITVHLPKIILPSEMRLVISGASPSL